MNSRIWTIDATVFHSFPMVFGAHSCHLTHKITIGRPWPCWRLRIGQPWPAIGLGMGMGIGRWMGDIHWIGFVGKIFTGNPWVFTPSNNYRAFRLKFSHHPILWDMSWKLSSLWRLNGIFQQIYATICDSFGCLYSKCVAILHDR